MKLLTKEVDYEKTIIQAQSLGGNYNKNVLFHCYWSGNLIEKHYYSIKSCYFFNVSKKENRKIILWVENNEPNEYNDKIKEYAEIRPIDLKKEHKGTFMEYQSYYFNSEPRYYSDLVRMTLLYNYGGCWFDLDVLFIRNIDPLFVIYEYEIICYQWEHQNYPNGALYISLQPKSDKMKYNMEYIIKRNRGWGFQEAELTYDLPLDMYVLPCSWFDGGWISNPYNIDFNIFKNTTEKYTFNNFFQGAFCFHWHNQCNTPIEENSIFRQLSNLLEV